MGLHKGQTNNRAGRPGKERALTTILQRVLAETRAVPDSERKTAGKQLLARYVVDAVLTGKLPYQVTVPLDTGGTLEVDAQLAPAQWLDLAKWLYTHLDGPPPAQIQADGKLQIVIEYGNPDPDPT